MNRKSHQWTKGELKTLLSLWETKNIDDIASELRLLRSQVAYMVSEVRKVDKTLLAKKKKHGYVQGLINEIIAELK